MDVNFTLVVKDLDQEDPLEAKATEKPLPYPATVEPTTSLDEVIIFFHTSYVISSLQTLKIKGYIKYH